ncbi:uncharacterized protein C7orf50 homolog [Phyllostomus hastatus]|uniref:uncharacterized protein C7orf50 homolog n=1 Tax=Phyllostomus hastatus TaxID=9423 RepID=UPI001E684850|nr:uncharacterized protein C7orf50 homolog [Phyllostomus hastatus]
MTPPPAPAPPRGCRFPLAIWGTEAGFGQWAVPLPKAGPRYPGAAPAGSRCPRPRAGRRARRSLEVAGWSLRRGAGASGGPAGGRREGHTEGVSVFRLRAALRHAWAEPPAASDFLSRRFAWLRPLQSPGRRPRTGLVHSRGSGEGGEASEGGDGRRQGEASCVSRRRSARRGARVRGPARAPGGGRAVSLLVPALRVRTLTQRKDIPGLFLRSLRMAKQKRRASAVPEQGRRKKLRKAAAAEAVVAREGAQGSEQAPEGRGVCSDPEPAPEEKRVLERKLKKERRRQERRRLREAGAAPAQPPRARPTGAQLALDYLRSWARKQEDWRFQKTRQTWLLLHMYDSHEVPEEDFPSMLAYLEGLQGQARKVTVQKAESLMWELDHVGADYPGSPLLEKIRRVRQVLQLLS